MTTRDRFQPPVQPEDQEFEDDEPAELDPVDTFVKGSLAPSIVPQLIALVQVYAKPEKKTEIEAFLRWVPAVNLEMFLVHCMEYGAETCHPTRKTRRKVAGKAASPRVPGTPPLDSQDPESGIHVGTPEDPGATGGPPGGA